MLLSAKKIRLNQLLSLAIVLIISATFHLFTFVSAVTPEILIILILTNFVVSYNIYSILTKKYRERQKLENTPFPEKWREILEEYVAFYRALSEVDKRRFETEIQIFLHETRITGVKTEVDDLTLVLAAASAEIPVFSFPDWEYENLGEILIYPGAFDKNFRTEGHGRSVWGMVGTGVMQGMMILSKPALISGFQNSGDKLNVGIHEFAHLLDAADGNYDGVPEVFLQNQYLEPWLEVMHKEIERIKAGKSNMNPYGATNKVEFFAVASEYFFERPEVMQKREPELYELMQKIFQQDTKQHFRLAAQAMMGYNGRKLGRNSPCPCGSGKKYKQCCLKNARQY